MQKFITDIFHCRLVVEICQQHAWTFPSKTVTKIAESFAILTFGLAFFHGSETLLGGRQDGMSNNLFTCRPFRDLLEASLATSWHLLLTVGTTFLDLLGVSPRKTTYLF